MSECLRPPPLQGGDHCPCFQGLFFHKMVRASRHMATLSVCPQCSIVAIRKKAEILFTPSTTVIILNKGNRKMAGTEHNSFLRFLSSRPGCPTNSPCFSPPVHFSLPYVKLGGWKLISKGSSSSGSLIKYRRCIIRGDTWELLAATA